MSQADQQKFEKEIREYYTREYIKIIGLNNIKDKSLRIFLQSCDLNYYSHKNRIIGNVQELKYTYSTSKTSTIAICFKASIDSTSCIYAYLYCDLLRERSPGYRFICTGPTFRSQDGEYRSRIITWE